MPNANITRAEVCQLVDFIIKWKSISETQPPGTTEPPVQPPLTQHFNNVDELLDWIETANEDNCDDYEYMKNFLDPVRQLGHLLTVHNKNDEYKLGGIVVDPQHEYVSYVFYENGIDDNWLQFHVYLPSQQPMEEVITEINNIYKDMYEDLRYEKRTITFQDEEIELYSLEGETPHSPAVQFEINEFRVVLQLNTNVTLEKFITDYLYLFEFKMNSI